MLVDVPVSKLCIEASGSTYKCTSMRAMQALTTTGHSIKWMCCASHFGPSRSIVVSRRTGLEISLQHQLTHSRRSRRRGGRLHIEERPLRRPFTPRYPHSDRSGRCHWQVVSQELRNRPRPGGSWPRRLARNAPAAATRGTSRGPGAARKAILRIERPIEQLRRHATSGGTRARDLSFGRSDEFVT
jgi:hypothetical protein